MSPYHSLGITKPIVKERGDSLSTGYEQFQKDKNSPRMLGKPCVVKVRGQGYTQVFNNAPSRKTAPKKFVSALLQIALSIAL